MVNNKEIYQLFKTSVLIKGAVSRAEIILGTIVLVIPASFFTTFAETLTRGELTDENRRKQDNSILSLCP